MRSITRIVGVLAVTLGASFLIQPYRPVVVSGQSMTPTFQSGQLAFSGPLDRPPQVGDVVLVERDGAMLIKRIAMVPGDQYIEANIRHSHIWTIVRTPEQKRLVARGIWRSRVRTVPSGLMYILGDNPQVSLDSRSFGLVPVDSIHGLVYSLS
jgi:signal peptidase I